MQEIEAESLSLSVLPGEALLIYRLNGISKTKKYILGTSDILAPYNNSQYLVLGPHTSAKVTAYRPGPENKTTIINVTWDNKTDSVETKQLINFNYYKIIVYKTEGFGNMGTDYNIVYIILIIAIILVFLYLWKNKFE